ncbi:lipopolysaccharide assembly LapA domain-containing protein [Mycobacterium sp. SMC-18]|uniref:LapA family protein n=1 Tax=Mycobacteriaceae TaxID=1762 RepID=UPI00299ED8D0|nr:lipopolysaccharide assembly protein LapA domain-containing protein [Mycolicibacterium sp. 141076]MDX1876250.1 lipopolysaccharide assembly protein LapA domain-containing protein [Mycolicibacterium sp. 141076]
MSSDHASTPEPTGSESEPAAVPAEPPAPKSPKPGTPDKKSKTPESAVKFTRTAALWTALVLGFLILILLLVFILQNGDDVTLRLFGWQLTMQKGVAILLSAVAGGLLTFAVASIRILQLRLAARKNLKAGL